MSELDPLRCRGWMRLLNEAVEKLSPLSLIPLLRKI